MLGIKVGTVKSQAHLGMARMREALAQTGLGPGLRPLEGGA